MYTYTILGRAVCSPLNHHYEACIPDVAEASRIYILHSIYTHKHVCLQMQVCKFLASRILLDSDRITFLFGDSCGLAVGFEWRKYIHFCLYC